MANELLALFNPEVETVEADEIILPTLTSLPILGKPDYIDGVRTNVNSHHTIVLNEFNGSTKDLIHEIGADFKAERIPAYRVNAAGAYVPVKNNSFIINSNTDEIIGEGATDRYAIIDFDESIYLFMALIAEIEKHGYKCSPEYGRVWGGGRKLMLQYKITSGDGRRAILNEPVDTYVSLLSSHDKSAGFTIALSAIRCFCVNQISHMLKEATNKISFKHTTGSRNFIEARAHQMIQAEEAQFKALADYCGLLSTIKADDQMAFNALAKVYDLENMNSMRAVHGFENRASNFFACCAMDDVQNWNGTALKYFYAYSDLLDHVNPLRKTSAQNKIERGLDGNLQLKLFGDALVQACR